MATAGERDVHRHRAYAGTGAEGEVPAVGDREVVRGIVEERQNLHLSAAGGASRIDVVVIVAEFKLGADAIGETKTDRTLDERGVAGVDLVDLVAAGIEERIL